MSEDLAKRRLERRLGRARADLVALPDLMAELARCRTERLPDDGSNRHGKPGSRPPMRLDVLHLVDDRRKPGWEGDDPRLVRLSERYGVAPLLETWTRVLAEELPEYPDLAEHATVRSESAVLVEHWDWIADQQWANELADDVITVTGWVRVSLAMRPEYRPRCRYCGDWVNPVDGDHHASTWQACAFGICAGCGKTFPKGPALDALGQVQPPLTMGELVSATGVSVRTLRDYRARGLIAPVSTRGTSALFDLAQVVEAIAKVRQPQPRSQDGKYERAKESKPA